MGIKVARASAEELSNALDLIGILESLDGGYYPSAPGAGPRGDEPTFFDEDDTNHLRHAYDLVMEVVKRRPGGLGRVIWGAATMMDPRNQIIDPDADTVKLHPRIVAALEAPSVPEGHVTVPIQPEPERIESMAMRLDHGHGAPMPAFIGGEIGVETPEATASRCDCNRRVCRQLYEEAIGQGFYRAETHSQYTHLVPDAPAQPDGPHRVAQAADGAAGGKFDARADAERLRNIASGLTYNDSQAEGEAKHTLHEIAMRLATGGYQSGLPTTLFGAVVPELARRDVAWIQALSADAISAHAEKLRAIGFDIAPLPGVERKHVELWLLNLLHRHGGAWRNVAQTVLAGGKEPERTAPVPWPTFQERMFLWTIACFGEEVTFDKQERGSRLLEETLELVQAGGYTSADAHALVDYVFARPVGKVEKEAGGVMTTLAALCNAHEVDMVAAGETELERISRMIPAIQAKHATKPRNSPLPGRYVSVPAPAVTDLIEPSELDVESRFAEMPK